MLCVHYFLPFARINGMRIQWQVDVNGPNTAPIYKFLKSSAGGFLGDLVKWNFEKFLVDKNGKVVERYPPTTSPFQIEVCEASLSLYVTLDTLHLICKVEFPKETLSFVLLHIMTVKNSGH
jgi:hypothetical protein